MKTKYFEIVTASLLLASAPMVEAYDNPGKRNYNERIELNTHFYDNDFYYSSRIRRFHRSYQTISYYSPLFTDVYWYNYQPLGWAISIYGAYTPDMGFSFGIPIVGYGYSVGFRWHEPFAWDYYYDWYRPRYFVNCYMPPFINVHTGSFWTHNYHAFYDHRNYYYDFMPFHENYANYHRNASPDYSYSENHQQKGNHYSYKQPETHKSQIERFGGTTNRSDAERPRRDNKSYTSPVSSKQHQGNLPGVNRRQTRFPENRKDIQGSSFSNPTLENSKQRSFSAVQQINRRSEASVNADRTMNRRSEQTASNVSSVERRTMRRNSSDEKEHNGNPKAYVSSMEKHATRR